MTITDIYRFHVSTISFVQVIFKGKGYFIVLRHLYHCGHGHNGLKMKLYLEVLHDWGPVEAKVRPLRPHLKN